MRLDKFTIKAQEALQQAQQLAAENGQQEILPEHLLAALLAQPEGIVPPILMKLAANVDAARADSARAIEPLPQVGRASVGEELGQRLRAARDVARNEARRARGEYVS